MMNRYLDRSYRYSIRESSKEKEVQVDFPITVNSSHRISFRDAKKLFKYLKEHRMLRKGCTYFVTDSEGNETSWDYGKSPYYRYYVEFSCEIADEYYDEKKEDYVEYDVYHSLRIGIDSRGRLDTSDIEWDVEKIK